MNLLMAAALDYAARSWPVLPLHGWDGHACSCGHSDCGSPAKHPRTQNGLKNATCDPEVIRSWWGRWPTANIGILTGIAFDVLDVDGEPGLASVAAMEAQHGKIPMGPTSFTGGGGIHRLLAVTGEGNRAGLLDKVDWRGKNGYIVAPPSLHATGNHYEWAEEGPDQPVSEVTGWLREMLFPPRAPAGLAIVNVGSSRDANAYARRAFDSEIGELARAGEGTRNHTLNAASFSLYQLVRGGELDEREVTDALQRVATGIGLNDREITATLKSAWEGTVGQGRSVPILTVVAGGAVAIENVPDTDTRLLAVAVSDVTVEPDTSSKHDHELIEFIHQPEPDYDWLLPDLAERGDRIILTGPEGGGKSTFLRQIFITAAAGIHPFTLNQIEPRRTLLIDLENGRRHLRRSLRPLWLAARDQIEPGMARVISLPSGIDLCSPEHTKWLRFRFEIDRPDVVCIGPIYKMANGDPTSEEVAKKVAYVLDDLRSTYGCAFFIEAHQPYSQGGNRPERPYGASLWSRWPEFGLHLSVAGNLRHWRGDRDERDWPPMLKRGGEWPWTVEHDPKAITFAKILQTVRDNGRRLTFREIAKEMGGEVHFTTIQRAVAANQGQFDAVCVEVESPK